jgi:hypothetical protein
VTQSISGWQSLPAGQDIAIRKGYTYAVVASVSRSYSKATILSHVPAGIELIDYTEQGERSDVPIDPDPDHRTVAAKLFATADAGTLPWKSPWPTTIYSLTQAWWATGPGEPTAPPVGTPNPLSGPLPWLVGGVALSGVALLLYLWARSRRR